jgi:hypothetical protein
MRVANVLLQLFDFVKRIEQLFDYSFYVQGCLFPQLVAGAGL